MGVQDANVVDGKEGRVSHKAISFALDSVGTGLTDDPVLSHSPDYDFEIIDVEVFCQATVATAALDVKIGSTSALASAITPVADTEVKGTIEQTSEQFGNAGDAINVEVTTDGTGTITGLQGRVWIRKQARKQG